MNTKKQKTTKSTFNPVKEETGDVRAKRIVWSTEILNAAVAALGAGKRLKVNPFYENEITLLKADLVYERTPEEIEEWQKCRNDIIYFADKYCKMMTPEGIQHVQLRDYQRDYLEHLMKNRLSIFLSCRQSGKTTTSALFMLHYICFNIDKNALVLGNKRRTSVEILTKLKDIYKNIPFFLRPGVSKWNESEIVLDNGCRCMAEATTINSGISFTFHCVLCDEFAHIHPNIVDKFYNNIFPTITAARARLMITSTQNGYNLFYRLYKAAEAGESEYAPFKVDWWQVPEWDDENHCWVPRDETWHKRQVANLGSEENFNKQFGTSFDVSANTLISQKKLKKYQDKGLVEFVNKPMLGVPYNESWWWHPDIDPMELKNETLIITVDIAEGLGQDYTCFLVNRLLAGEVLECIGFFRSNTLNHEKCAEALMQFEVKWCGPLKHLVSIERNTYGDIFLMDMFKLQNESIPLWNQGNLVKYYNESGSKFNYAIKITPGNKSTMCMLFKEDFEAGRIINQSTTYANELLNFCDNGSGHYEASFGHDDLVMCSVQLQFVKQTLQYKYLKELIDVTNSDAFNPYEVMHRYDVGSNYDTFQYESNNTNQRRLR